MIRRLQRLSSRIECGLSASLLVELNHFTELANENIVEAFAAGACFHFSSITPSSLQV